MGRIKCYENSMCDCTTFLFWRSTGTDKAFPGTFAFRKETIMACIEEYLENLDRFGFKRVVFFNDYGDELHILAIAEAIKNANRKLELQAYWMEYEYELKEHVFSVKRIIF